MFFEDIAIIYDSNILEYSQSFKSSWVEQEMLDANSDVNVFEYYDEYVKCALISRIARYEQYESSVTFFTAKDVFCRQE